MTRNGKFFTAASRDCVTVWQMTPTISKIDTIAIKLSESQKNKTDLLDSITEHNERKKKKEEAEANRVVLASLDNEGQ